MSKLLKSKILLGVMIFAVMFVGFAVVKTASAEGCDLGSVTLKQGMKSDAVLCLQTKLGVTPATSYFGSITKGKVVAYQAANTLTPDGIVGAKTKAALAGITTPGTFPAGCTSNTGYSTTTGLSCAATELPAGCTSTEGYSSTTGAKCDSGTGSTTLTGGAGTVSAYALLSSPANNREVIQAGSDTKVMGFSVEADTSSDLQLTAVKVELCNDSTPGAHCDTFNGTANRAFNKYAKEVSIMLGSNELARASASDFTEDNNYSKTMTLSGGANAIIKAGKVANLYVLVSGINNLDSNDHGKTWGIDVTSVRYVDAQGGMISEDPAVAARTFTFETPTTSGDLNINLLVASDSPDTSVVEVDDVTNTDGVLLLKGTLKASGDDLMIKELQTTITPANTGELATIASAFILKINGEEVQSLDALACDTGGDICDGDISGAAADTYTFDNVDFKLTKGSTATIEIVANVNDIEAGLFDEGDSLTADITLSDAGNIIRDTAGDDLVAGDKTGSILGRVQSFESEGIIVKVTSTSTSVTPDGDGATYLDGGQFTWTVDIKAFGDKAVYINRNNANVVATTTADDNAEIGYTIEYSGGDALTSVGATSSESDADVTDATGDSGAYGAAYNAETFYKIAQGTTGTFTFSVSGTNQTDAKQVRAYLDNIEWTTDNVEDATGASDALVADVNDYIFDITDVSKTPYKSIS